MATAKLIPNIKENGLKTFNVSLDFPDLDREGCSKINGDYERTEFGDICFLREKNIADVSMNGITFGRIFTDLTAPVTVSPLVELKEGASLRFDCGYGTNDLYVDITDLIHGLKAMDMSCRKPPSKPDASDMYVITPHGIVGSKRPEI